MSKGSSQEDKRQFEKIVLSHQRAIFHYILTMVPHVSDAEEIHQETNLAIWRSRNRFVLGSNFRAWAFQIAFHRILKHRTKKRRGGLLFSNELMETFAEEANNTMDIQQARSDALSFCMRKLSPKDRELLHLYYQPGSSGATVSEKLRRSVGSIYKSVWRIRRSLLECITRRLASEIGK